MRVNGAGWKGQLRIVRKTTDLHPQMSGNPRNCTQFGQNNNDYRSISINFQFLVSAATGPKPVSTEDRRAHSCLVPLTRSPSQPRAGRRRWRPRDATHVKHHHHYPAVRRPREMVGRRQKARPRPVEARRSIRQRASQEIGYHSLTRRPSRLETPPSE